MRTSIYVAAVLFGLLGAVDQAGAMPIDHRPILSKYSSSSAADAIVGTTAAGMVRAFIGAVTRGAAGLAGAARWVGAAGIIAVDEL